MSERVKRRVPGVCAGAFVTTLVIALVGVLVIALVAYAFAGYLTPAALVSLLSGLAFCG
jgi:hypothetical protein